MFHRVYQQNTISRGQLCTHSLDILAWEKSLLLYQLTSIPSGIFVFQGAEREFLLFFTTNQTFSADHFSLKETALDHSL